jgi:hypothetical protein
VSAVQRSPYAPFPPLHSLQNLWPQFWQTCVNLRVRFPHLQHFNWVTFCPRGIELFVERDNSWAGESVCILRIARKLKNDRLLGRGIEFRFFTPIGSRAESCQQQ